MTIKYKNTSPFFLTQIVNSSYLGFYSPRNFRLDGTEETIKIESKYENRPDLLAHEIYGTVELWWVFMVANPDKIVDSLTDMVAGLEILIPRREAIV